MKIMVANPPAYFKEFPDRHFIQAGSRWSFSMNLPRGHDKDHYQPYPFTLGYLSASLKREGSEVVAVDACAGDLTDEEFKDVVRSYEPGYLYVEVPTVSLPMTVRLLKEIRDELGCLIDVMGAHSKARVRDFPQGEFFFRNNHPLPPSNPDISGLPFPDRDDLPIGDYHDFEFHKPTAQILSSWGCPSSCSFCLQRHVIYRSPKYWRRTAESVVDEMELCTRLGARQIYFDDDTMTVYRKHVESICGEILKRRLDLPWTCMGDVTLKPETLALMRKAGCIGIKFGVETVSRATLRAVGKHFLKIKRVSDFVRNCVDLGIWSHATYIIGLPNDRRKDIEKTIDFAVELGSNSCQFSIATPFPGTPFYKQCEGNGWLTTKDWTKYDGARNSVVSYPWLSDKEVEELFQKAMRVRKKYGLRMRDKVKVKVK